MGFMDKAKEAAEDLKASFATTEVRDSEQQYRDLGMLAYLIATEPADRRGRPAATGLRHLGRSSRRASCRRSGW